MLYRLKCGLYTIWGFEINYVFFTVYSWRERNARSKSEENEGARREDYRVVVFCSCVENSEIVVEGVFGVMKAKRRKKEQVQKASVDSVDWFLAIDGCLA